MEPRTYDINNYNELKTLYRVTSYILRFISNLKCKSAKKSLQLTNYVTIIELRKSRSLWIKANQRQLFTSKDYIHGERQLNLYEDKHNIICSRGRLENTKLPYSTKCPTVLHRAHKLSLLIVEDCHRTVLHRGQNQTLTKVRTQYWIIKGKSFVKKVLLNCKICKKFQGRPYAYPKTPSLPRERVEGEFPFKATGVDHLGPVHIRDVFGSSDEEDLHTAFITLYTCASSRGVLLDLVHDTSAESFISSCTRFISRRGCPHILLSDNGTAFTAKKTQEFAARKNIEWKCSIAEAPWFAGFWERLVACVKNCLKKTIGRTTLRYNEMQTVLMEVEMILNPIPLVPL